MHLVTLATLVFGTLTLTLAAPVDERRDECCCCNIGKLSIVCRDTKDGCFCPAVLCPSGAPTIFENLLGPTESPVKDDDDDDDDDCDEDANPFECCCCNPETPAIECSWAKSSEDCVCLAVACPTEAPTVWPYGTGTTTEAPTATATATDVPNSDEPCCCCDIGREAIVCTVREEGEDNSCFCPMVMCPSGAPTVTEYPGPKETGP